MKEIVINGCYGGFGVSRAAFLKLREMGNVHALQESDVGESWKDGSGVRHPTYDSFLDDIPRDDPDFVKVVKEMGELASARFASLRIVEIPDDVSWTIDEYDGNEWVSEKHQTWR